MNNVLYFVGGRLTEYQFTGVVWAYSPETKTWSSKATMPTARISVVCVVENGLINVMGGYNGSFLSTVESYNPATDTWTEEAPMLSPESDVSAALIGNTILVANGSGGWVDGHNQSYNAATNTWTFLNSDPTLRQGSCSGSIGPRLYSAGGWDDVHGDALTLTESFTLSTGAWKTLAPMPQGTMGLGRSVVYGERLYCFGGEYSNNGTPVHNLAIYQP